MADNLPVEVNENNTPDRNERNIVPEGNRKVSYKKESDNSGCFTFEGEDHTLGAPLRMKLLRDPNVVFAGYKVPNPLARNLEVRIETTSESSPMQAYNQAINDLDRELDHLKNAFEAEIARFSRDQ